MAEWERLPGESRFWFHRFDMFYRPRGPDRSIHGSHRAWLASKGDERPNRPASSAWRRNAKRWEWRKRAEAWDEKNRQERIALEEQQRADMLRRHSRLGQALQGIGAARLTAYRSNAELVPAAQARMFIETGIRIERQSRGLPDHLLAVSQMSEDQLLDEYDRLRSQLGLSEEALGDLSGDASTGPDSTVPSDPG